MPPKKLIEVAMPLEAINAASAREKSIRHGHPSTLHLWWARRPLAAARAVIFASLVDAPSSRPELFPTEEDQRRERERLFAIIEELVQWENSNNPDVLNKAKEEIARWTGGHPPELLDPFAGGGAIPLEAQRLGLVSHARDLNPVAVLINKAMIELPPKFAGRKPVNPEAKSLVDEWPGASGLAEDVRHYGQWMKERAFEKIGHLYPKVKDAQGQPRTVIAWLWARTVKCPNPVCGCQMPLAASFVLSKKKGHEAYVQPVVKGKRVSFEVHEGKDAPDPPKQSRGANFQCVACGGLAGPDYIKAEAKAGRMGAQLMAVVAEGHSGRVYLAADKKQVGAADVPKPEGYPEGAMPTNPRWFSPPAFGLTEFHQLFTNRQLTALTTFSDLVKEAREQIVADGSDEEYANAVALYLAFVADKLTQYHSSMSVWHTSGEKMSGAFGRQAIAMTWDYAEGNPFCLSSGCYDNMLEWVVKCASELPASGQGEAIQHEAQERNGLRDVMVCTDPPYYDNIGYADLSDYFYVWLRRALKDIYPSLFSTIMTPKADEMIATPFRHEGSREEARAFFEGNMLQAFRQIHDYARDDVPTTVFYAYKQSESDDGGEASTGWETMLKALIDAGFSITGTWPIRTELTTALKTNVNALASSIVLVCRKRPADAPSCSLRDFEGALRRELRPALGKLQNANIAPVDMAQSAIGPGMAVYSRYREILKRDGAAVTVREALKIINKELDSILSQREEGLDDATRFCLDLYTQARYDSVKYDDALKLARGRNVTLDALDGLCVEARRGHVRLLRPDEVPAKPDDRMVWLLAQQLARAMDTGGVLASAQVAAATRPEAASQAKDLAYRLYSLAEKKGWGQDAAAYNNLVTNWGRVAGQAETLAAPRREKDKDLIDQIEERPEQ